MIIPLPEVRESAPASIQICQMMGDHSEPSSMLRFNLPRSPEISEKSVYKVLSTNCRQFGSCRVGRHGRSRRPAPMPARQTSWLDSPWPWGPPRKPWGATGTSDAVRTEAASGIVRGPQKLRARRAVVCDTLDGLGQAQAVCISGLIIFQSPGEI